MASNFPTAYIRVASQTYVLQHIFHFYCFESDCNESCVEIMGCCSIHALLLLLPFTVLFYYSLPPPIHRIFSQCCIALQSCNLNHVISEKISCTYTLYFVNDKMNLNANAKMLSCYGTVFKETRIY